jgi:hypothetical protein
MAREIRPIERVSLCLRRPIPGVATIDVCFSEAWKSAFYAGLQTCGSVWMCPVCAARIGERRRIEVSAAIDACHAAGGVVYLATYTLRHNAGQRLLGVLNCLRGAQRQLKQGKAYQGWKERVGLWGTISSLEVTHGKNGWHPHIHELLFLRAPLSDHQVTVDLQIWLSSRWRVMVDKYGGDASTAHGFDLKTEKRELDKYLTKQASGSWDFSHEVAKSILKRSRGDSQGRSMMRLLYEYAFHEDEQAGVLWGEYADTFKGRKHLFWSPGLRSALLGDDQSPSDEELAAEVDPAGLILAQLTWSQWGQVLRSDMRGELLEVAASGDEWAVAAFLDHMGIQTWRN